LAQQSQVRRRPHRRHHLLATATRRPCAEGIDFFPLTSTSRSGCTRGQDTGSFFRRRAATRAPSHRPAHRPPLRPSFADGYRNEPSVITSWRDQVNPHDVLAITPPVRPYDLGLPFEGPIGPCGSPTRSPGSVPHRLREATSHLRIVWPGGRCPMVSCLMMVEPGPKGVVLLRRRRPSDEEVIAEGLERQTWINESIDSSRAQVQGGHPRRWP